jgi:hypothetical protein
MGSVEHGLGGTSRHSNVSFARRAVCDHGSMVELPSNTPEGPIGSIKWLEDVAAHDYDAAQAYLSLKLGEEEVAKAVKHLRQASVTKRRANDILRAAELSAAPLDDPGVMKDLIKVIEGRHLSPVLVISNKKRADIADGYHRVSLVYRLDPYGEVPLKLA